MAKQPTNPRREPPRCVVIFALEARPKIIVDTLDSGEYARLSLWIQSHAEIAGLITAAANLEREPA
jgi:hypothetical protein